jgi:pyruvate/2-oxoglutarate dehydrogenase complex dihydrolipoamide acyltransferase (E2) component
MPKLAMAMQEGQVVEWLFEEGAWVEKGRPVMVVETEKVTHECESPASGYLHRLVEPGVTVPVFQPVALLAATEAELRGLKQAATASAPPAGETAPVGARPASTGKKERVNASPIARELAAKYGLELAAIQGSGPGGRITKEDVEKAFAGVKLGTGQMISAPSFAAAPQGVFQGRKAKSVIPLQGMRKTISDRMHRSLALAAQLSVMGEVDMSETVQLRQQLLAREAELGVRITYTDLMVLAMAKAVSQVPLVNASLVGDEIWIWEDINIGVAVALEKGPNESGLIVPVVKNADKKSLVEISKTVRDLAERAKNGTLTAEEVTGGTITLSNAGMFAEGWGFSTPILNYPEVIIVQPGRICDRPAVRDGSLVVRPLMSLSITHDHRVLDGVPVAHFYNKLKELLENPATLDLSLP